MVNIPLETANFGAEFNLIVNVQFFVVVIVCNVTSILLSKKIVAAELLFVHFLLELCPVSIW